MAFGEIIQVASGVGGLAACLATWFAYWTAKAARTQADASWELVRLQRPRPVVTVEGDWNFENSSGGPDGFGLKNVGSSPAFHIEVSDIEGPVLRQAQHRETLTTESILLLEEKEMQVAIHHRCMPGNVIDDQAAFKFVQNASRAFSPRDEDGNPTLDHELNFFVAYSTLDGRRIRTECLIRFNLGADRRRARIVPVSGWLGVETPEKKRENSLEKRGTA